MPTNIANGIYYCTNPEDREQTINYLLSLVDKLESNTANSPPVASPLSSPAHSSEALQINLIGSDADGDTLIYELVSPVSAEAYDSAYIQGNVLYVQMSNTFDAIGSTTLEYHVTDGQQFSQPATVTLQAEVTTEERGLGLQLTDSYAYSQIPRGDLNGLLFGAAGGVPTLPRRIDLSDSFPPPGNQGRQGSCVGWATAYALKSYQERVEEGWSLVTSDGSPNPAHIFSPAFIYNQINGGQDSGSDPYTALQFIVDKGAATLATMPYDENDYLTQPSTTAFAEAAHFKGAEVKVADGTLAIKDALANRLPVVAGIFVYNSLNYLSGSNAVYNDSGNVCEKYPYCGHAVTIVGYDDDKFGGAFKIINSWGPYWGDQGYFWLPYDFARQSAPWQGQGGQVLAMSFYLKDADNTGVIEPNPTPTPPPSQNLPNLQVESWTASYDERPGGSGELQYSVINTGTVGVVANTVDVNLMLSADVEVSSNDIYVVYETVPLDIGPGGSVYRDQNNAISFYFPSYISAGTYYMGVWVDDLNRVQESNEDDNFAPGELTINIKDTLPDLVVRTWYAEWDEYSGYGALEYEVANEGVSATTLVDWDINLVLSSDEIIGNGDEWILFYEPGNYVLQPGESVYRDAETQAYFQLYTDVLGYSIPAGIYYMALWVDGQQREQESDEYNNYSLGNELAFIGGNNEWASFSSLRSTQHHESYNGKPLPKNVMLRKVQLLDTPDGKRHLRLLEETLEYPMFDKQQRSANQVVFPTVQRTLLPTEINHEHTK
jgi:C1A family cysteine protease